MTGVHSSKERFSSIKRVLWLILVLNLLVAGAKSWDGTI